MSIPVSYVPEKYSKQKTLETANMPMTSDSSAHRCLPHTRAHYASPPVPSLHSHYVVVDDQCVGVGTGGKHFC